MRTWKINAWRDNIKVFGIFYCIAASIEIKKSIKVECIVTDAMDRCQSLHCSREIIDTDLMALNFYHDNDIIILRYLIDNMDTDSISLKSRTKTMGVRRNYHREEKNILEGQKLNS